MLEIKSTTGSGIITDVDTAGRNVEVYLSEYHTVDSHNDRVQKNAYANTINSGIDKPFLWNHQLNTLPLGTFKAKEFREDDFGLRAVGTLNKTSLANDALICYQNGDIREHSVGIFTIKSKKEASGVRVITEAYLAEGSAVNIASNPNTHVIGLKSNSLVELMDEYKSLDERSRSLYKMITKGNLTDEFCYSIAAEHALITKSMADIIEALSKKEPEIISTPVVAEPLEVKSQIDVYAEFMKTYK